MKLLPEVCLEARKTLGDYPYYDPDYDPDPIWILQICMKILPKVCLSPMINPLFCRKAPNN